MQAHHVSQLALHADSLTGIYTARKLYEMLSAPIRNASNWADRMNATLSRAYYGNGGKVQVRNWNRALQYALYVAGWEVYARPIGIDDTLLSPVRYQLIFAPTRDSILRAPTELMAQRDNQLTPATCAAPDAFYAN